ncbi:MAG: DedA family protein [Coprothermobacterota bacterium]|nr:DedA family protein [Coprothermobacterota bacterium]
MIHDIIAAVAGWIINMISATGYWGIFLLMALESALIPIPSEITMPFAGYLAGTGLFNLWWVILVGAFANLVGSLLVFWLGWWGQEAWVRRVLRRYGRFLFLSEEKLDHAEVWLRRHGEKIAFFSRLLPVVRTFISLPMGMARMNPLRFSLFTFFGSLIWSAVLTYAGYAMGQNWQALEPYYREYEIVLVALAVTVLAFWIWRRVRKRLQPPPAKVAENDPGVKDPPKEG